ncbi:MAG: DUF4836 family protein [Flavobacteriales bacterium]
MKVLKIIGIVLVCLLFIGGIIYLINKSQNDSANASVFEAIPADADAVMVINIEAFMTLILTNLPDIIELSEELKGDQDMEKFQKEAQLTGINLSRKVAIYLKNERVNVLVPVTSKQVFGDYLEDLALKSNLTALSETEYYSSDLGAYINFNEELCFISQMRRSEVEGGLSEWNKIITPKEGYELSAEFSNLKETDEHLAVFMKENEMALRSPVFEYSPAQFSTLTFEDGLIRIDSKVTSDKPDLKNPLREGGIGSVASDYLSFHANINPESDLDFWLTNEARTEWEKGLADADAKESSKEFLKKWNGLINFSITGTEKGLEEVITYDYDDNFNLVEKKELLEKSNMSYTGYLGFNEPLSSKDFLKDQIENDKLFFSEGSDNSLTFSSSENISNETPSSEHAVHLVAYPKALIELGADIDLPFVQMADRFKDVFRKVELIANPDGNTINSELIIYTGEEDKNALIFLAGELRRFRY